MTAMARFKELCLDTTDPTGRIAQFWATVSGARAVESGGVYDVVGDDEYQGIAVCPVPESKTVKNRVHLDVYTRAVSDLEALGATVLRPAEESGLGWTVMADPEGNEFCAFVRDELPSYRVHGIGVDAVDAGEIAAWWAEVYDVPVRAWPGEDYLTLEHTTPDSVLTLDFAPVPEPKTVKNRLHWDVYGDPAVLVAHGATHLWDTERWTVLADPEGNEFCVFAPR